MARGDSVGQSSNDFAQIQKEFDRVKEKVEKLTGERGNVAAVRRTDLRTLASVQLQSSQIDAAPTQADFNNLQRDLSVIFTAIKKIANATGVS